MKVIPGERIRFIGGEEDYESFHPVKVKTGALCIVTPAQPNPDWLRVWVIDTDSNTFCTMEAKYEYFTSEDIYGNYVSIEDVKGLIDTTSDEV